MKKGPYPNYRRRPKERMLPKLSHMPTNATMLDG